MLSTLAKKTINGRIDFSSIEKVLDYPDFLDLQLQSFKDFLQIETPAEKRQNEGLFKVFPENFPISKSSPSMASQWIPWRERWGPLLSPMSRDPNRPKLQEPP